MRSMPFIKMHGLGNDFVVLDARDDALALNDEATRAIADRHTGVGCDQLIILENATGSDAVVRMRIRNADGGEVDACGNAARCIADLVMRETGRDEVSIETAAGLLHAHAAGARRAASLAGDPVGARLRHAACALERRAAFRSRLHQHGQSARDLLCPRRRSDRPRHIGTGAGA
jgi:diaminopimelate epimerase